MHTTNGRGVGLILNSLAGELLRASWQCLATLENMAEIVKRDLMGHGMFDLHGFPGSRAFCGCDLYTIAFFEPDRFKLYALVALLAFLYLAIRILLADILCRAIEMCLDLVFAFKTPLHCFKVKDLETTLR
jgi:Ca2+/H+ antiporter